MSSVAVVVVVVVVKSLLYFVCLPGVLRLVLFCGSSSQCCGLVCSVQLWYFLIMLAFLFVVLHYAIFTR